MIAQQLEIVNNNMATTIQEAMIQVQTSQVVANHNNISQDISPLKNIQNNNDIISTEETKLTTLMNNVHHQLPSDDNSKISWEEDVQKEDNNNDIDVQSSDEDGLYMSQEKITQRR